MKLKSQPHLHKGIKRFHFFLGAGDDPTATGRREPEARRLEVKDILLNGSGHVYLQTGHVIIDPFHCVCVSLFLPHLPLPFCRTDERAER